MWGAQGWGVNLQAARAFDAARSLAAAIQDGRTCLEIEFPYALTPLNFSLSLLPLSFKFLQFDITGYKLASSLI
jgi:hypothetical protein